MSWVSDSYYARFGKFPPVLYWRGTVKGLRVLMMQALERGTPLTADGLMEVPLDDDDVRRCAAIGSTHRA